MSKEDLISHYEGFNLKDQRNTCDIRAGEKRIFKWIIGNLNESFHRLFEMVQGGQNIDLKNTFEHCKYELLKIKGC